MRTILQRLSAALVLALLSILTMSASESITENGIKYQLFDYNNTACVSGYVDGIKYAEIPSKIYWNNNQYDVVKMYDGCFHDCKTLESIKISAGVSVIPYACFWGCFGLSSVTLPETVTALSDWSFSDCTSLEKITLPKSIQWIGQGCFRFSAINEITCKAVWPPTCSPGAFVDMDQSKCTVYVNDVDAYKNAWKEFGNITT